MTLLLSTLKNYSEIMTNLGYPEETAGCVKSIENSKNEIELVTEMWKFIHDTQELFEKFISFVQISKFISYSMIL